MLAFKVMIVLRKPNLRNYRRKKAQHVKENEKMVTIEPSVTGALVDMGLGEQSAVRSVLSAAAGCMHRAGLQPGGGEHITAIGDNW